MERMLLSRSCEEEMLWRDAEDHFEGEPGDRRGKGLQIQIQITEERASLL
jgi:hypothetical protein